MSIFSWGGQETAARLAALDKSQAIIEFKMDGTIITANKNFLDALGYTLDEIQGRHHSMFVEPALRDSAEYRDFWARLNRGEYQAAQYKRIGKNGREVWIEASYNPLLDSHGKPFKVVKFATDVSKAKAVYADLLGKVDAINHSQAVIEFELDGTIITANENFLKTMGYGLDEIKGQHHRIFVSREERESAEYRMFWDRLARGEFQAARYARVKKGGGTVWLQATYNPIMDLNGRPWKVVKFATDITAGKARDDLALNFVHEASSVIRSVSDSAQEMEATAQTAASATVQTNQQSSAVAGATEELSASVNEISRQIGESSRVISVVVKEAHNSERRVADLVVAAQKIGEVTKIISDIAGQTNLLALNATIEAARAGEAGKGFAVVASEVKSLATQTAKATEEIAQHIKGIQESSTTTAQAINEIGKVINQVSEISASISSAVEQQSAATREVSSNIAGVTQAAAETGQSSQTVLQISQKLSAMAAGLQGKVEEFMRQTAA
jgi:methyl-accepting chemotaxis protein